MANNSTELVFILDRSGSMGGLEDDTIGGFNAMLRKQKEIEGECRVTTVLFDNEYTLLHDRIDLRAVEPMTEKDYYVRGSTALVDAIGRTVKKIENVQEISSEEYRADHVMFVIITDGYENASIEYSSKQVKKMIEKEKKNGWEFIFLGANIDAVETAGEFGISGECVSNYVPDAKGTKLNFEATSDILCGARLGCAIDMSPLEMVRDDMKKRGGKK